MNQFLTSMIAAAAMAIAGVTSGFTDSITTALNTRSLEDVKKLHEAPVPEATACPVPGDVAISASQDASVARAFATTNYGHAGTLSAEATVLRPLSAGDQRVLLGFDLRSLNPICEIEQAELRLYAASAAPDRTLAVYGLAGEWDENAVTWASQPAPAGDPATAGSASGWQSFDATGSVAAARGDMAGLMVRDTEEGATISQAQVYASREGAPDQAPVLVITLR